MNIANIDRPSFIAELSSASEFSSVEKASQICDCLRTVLDKHAPPSMQKVITHNSSPWFESIRDEIFIERRTSSRENIEEHKVDYFQNKRKKMNDHQVLPYCVQVYCEEAWCMSWSDCCGCAIAFSAAYQRHMMSQYCCGSGSSNKLFSRCFLH